MFPDVGAVVPRLGAIRGLWREKNHVPASQSRLHRSSERCPGFRRRRPAGEDFHRLVSRPQTLVCVSGQIGKRWCTEDHCLALCALLAWQDFFTAVTGCDGGSALLVQSGAVNKLSECACFAILPDKILT